MVKNIKRTTSFSFEVWGKWALFTDPIMRLGGEKFTYPIPTYEAFFVKCYELANRVTNSFTEFPATRMLFS